MENWLYCVRYRDDAVRDEPTWPLTYEHLWFLSSNSNLTWQQGAVLGSYRPGPTNVAVTIVWTIKAVLHVFTCMPLWFARGAMLLMGCKAWPEHSSAFVHQGAVLIHHDFWSCLVVARSNETKIKTVRWHKKQQLFFLTSSRHAHCKRLQWQQYCSQQQVQ